MSSRRMGPEVGGIAGAAIAANLRVKIDSSGEYVVAGDEAFVGTNMREDVLAQGDEIAVMSALLPGSNKYVASKAIAVGDVVNTVAGGKVTDAAGVVEIGIAVEEALADGDVIQVMHTRDA